MSGEAAPGGLADVTGVVLIPGAPPGSAFFVTSTGRDESRSYAIGVVRNKTFSKSKVVVRASRDNVTVQRVTINIVVATKHSGYEENGVLVATEWDVIELAAAIDSDALTWLQQAP